MSSQIDHMDNFIVSARKYRPATFRQVVGQQAITSTLQNAIKNNHLAQAFLFTGPRGVGKTTCARILAKTINCTNLNADLEPCDQCESCRSFNTNSSFNIHELDAASNNSVDDIRNLVEQVRIPPQVGKYKVYIIDEVHMLSTSAFNAFLKTLEEPPAYAKFILATTEKHKIIPTILSRCQIFDFRRITVEDTANYLQYVADNEHITTDAEALHIIAQKSDGAMRDALSTFDQIVSYSGNNLTYKSVIENLNILDYEYFFRITDSILQRNITDLLLVFNEVIENGFDGQHFIMGLAEHLRSLLVMKNPETIQLMHASEQLKVRYKNQSSACHQDFLFKALDICNQYDLKYKASNNKRLHIEIALLALADINNQPAQVKASVAPLTSKPEPIKNDAGESKSTYQPVTKPVEKAPPPPVTKAETQTPSSPATPAAERTKPEAASPRKMPESETGNGKVMRNISIKKSMDLIKNGKENDDQKPVEVIDNPFTQQQLETAWNTFCRAYEEKSPSFANALAKYVPAIGDKHVITYKVDSLIISKDTLGISSLLEFLKKELHNNQITLTATVPDKTEPKKAYTDREKMERLIEKYPAVQKLKDQFNLEIGF